MPSHTKRLVVIGGVAAGMSAASAARRRDPNLEIVVYERSPYVSYGSCGLPYYISDVIKDHNSLIVYSPGYFKDKRNIQVYTRHQALRINPEQREVEVRNLEDRRNIKVSYDHLVIATGACAAMPPIPGADLPGAFTLRSLEDGIRLKSFVAEGNPRRAIIAGGGYIGLEMAEAFRTRGLEVTVIERLPRLMTSLDPEMSDLVASELAAHGVEILTGESIVAIEGDKAVSAVKTEKRTVEADLVLLALGARPNTLLATEAGLRIGETGAIAVNDLLQTSSPGIYAAGDCAETKHLLTGK